MTMMSDIDQFQTQTATPVRAPINFATTMVALQRLTGAGFVTLAFGMWFVPGASWASELMLIKLVLSVSAGLVGIAMVQEFAQRPAPEFEIDTVRREIRVFENRGKTRKIIEICKFADLTRVERDGPQLKLWNGMGEMMAEMSIHDRATLTNVTSALTTAGKL